MPRGNVVRVFAVGFRGGIEEHIVAQQIAKANWISVIMMLATGLMRVSRIERHAFIDVSIAVPITAAATAVTFRRAGPIIRIPRVEHRDAVHEITNGAATGRAFYRWHTRVARNA